MRVRTMATAALALMAALVPQVMMAATANQEFKGENNLPYLFGGFVIVWLGFFGYVFYLHRRERELRRELEALRREIKERQEGSRS
jgi:CcmD family protein